MATVGEQLVESYNAAADLRTKQFYIMKQSGANGVTVCAGTTDVPIGVLMNKPNSGEAALVQYDGVVKVVADAAVAVGAAVGTSADGQAVTKTANNDHIIGYALTACSNAGELIEVQMRLGQLGA